ncbi:futalosine hydrolase [Streptomyces chilikensis]|uniref:Futalosine hydrolase n=1 Tax=Streptomyces chilikensis TaxID=1194079 RepID=A0ABV3EVY5_9ACTN|nr:futalosine hydrolase [Streptomyces chilikensis]
MATAVPAEGDAVARAFGPAAGESRLPGGLVVRHLRTGGPDRSGESGGPDGSEGSEGPDGPLALDLLAAGVGPALAAASTATALTAAALRGEPYGLVVSAGIGGGFAPAAPVGSLVVADEITAADLGAETADGFLPVTELGFGAVTHRPPPALVRAAAAAAGAAAGPVLTASTVTGTAARAGLLRERHPGALAEAMEGFGVAEAAAAHGVPVLEIRAVSNPVGPRDRAAWRIPEALAALTTAFERLAPVLGRFGPERVEP